MKDVNIRINILFKANSAHITFRFENKSDECYARESVMTVPVNVLENLSLTLQSPQTNKLISSIMDSCRNEYDLIKYSACTVCMSVEHESTHEALYTVNNIEPECEDIELSHVQYTEREYFPDNRMAVVHESDKVVFCSEKSPLPEQLSLRSLLNRLFEAVKRFYREYCVPVPVLT